MSTGRPPAPDVASTRTSAPSSAPATRLIGAATPVEVSLWVKAYASTPASACGCGCVPGSEEMTVGSASHGASLAAFANLDENSPNDRCWDLEAMSPCVATSQNAVEPPLPRTTSYPSGSENRSRTPVRTSPTRFFTGAWRWDVPIRDVPVAARASSASVRTLEGPHRNGRRRA